MTNSVSGADVGSKPRRSGTRQAGPAGRSAVRWSRRSNISASAGSAESAVPTQVIARLAEAAARFASEHEKPNPASILAVATTRAKAPEVMFKGTGAMPGAEAVKAYAVAMTGRFASHRGGPTSNQMRLPLTGPALVVVFDAATLDPMDSRLGDDDDLALLARLGPVTILAGRSAAAGK